MSESYREQLGRLVAMSGGDPTWDLSPNDIAALKAVLSRLDWLEKSAEEVNPNAPWSDQPPMATMMMLRGQHTRCIFERIMSLIMEADSDTEEIMCEGRRHDIMAVKQRRAEAINQACIKGFGEMQKALDRMQRQFTELAMVKPSPSIILSNLDKGVTP